MFGQPLDWDKLAEYDWMRALQGCPQSPIYHGEGDVWTHTRMVCDALVNLRNYKQNGRHRGELLAAAVLHDIGKPKCTKTEDDGRITSKGHARVGSIMARRILWEMKFPFKEREYICNLVRYHMRPYYLLEYDCPENILIEISMTIECADLATFAEADSKGRISSTQDESLELVRWFRELSKELDIHRDPRGFKGHHSRFCHFNRGKHYMSHIFDDTQSFVIVMSGLPGSGKDHWIKEHCSHMKVISLDQIRKELGIDAADKQGKVIAKAKEEAKECLREDISFVWNATNISRELRSQCISLFNQYNAEVRIVYVETDPQTLNIRNKERDNPVPNFVIDKLLSKWEVPNLTEAHKVDYVRN